MLESLVESTRVNCGYTGETDEMDKSDETEENHSFWSVAYCLNGVAVQSTDR